MTFEVGCDTIACSLTLDNLTGELLLIDDKLYVLSSPHLPIDCMISIELTDNARYLESNDYDCTFPRMLYPIIIYCRVG